MLKNRFIQSVTIFGRSGRIKTLLIAFAVLCPLATLPAAASEPLRIMPLGDSITVGYTDNPGWNDPTQPFEFGYRSGLYTRLSDAGVDFQFVGSSTQPFDNASGDPTHGGTVSPTLDLRPLGQDGHRGISGNSINGVHGNVLNWIQQDDPDVILLLIGINGINSSSEVQLDALANTIVTNAPDLHLIIAQITPFANFNQTLFDYNNHIRDELVPDLVASGHSVSTVDLYTMFLDDPNDPTSIGSGLHANQINHPTNEMYDQMAEAWFDGINSSVPEPSSASLLLVGGLLLSRRRRVRA